MIHILLGQMLMFRGYVRKDRIQVDNVNANYMMSNMQGKQYKKFTY